MRRHVFALLLVAAPAIAGCDAESGVVPDVAAIRRERRAWQAQGISDYVFVWSRSCFCDWSEPNGGMRVIVRSGRAQSAVGQQSGIPRPRAAVSIDEIFDEVIEWATDRTAPYSQYAIQFDVERHYIRQVDLDEAANGADDEYSMSVSCFSLEADGCPLRTLTEQECLESGGSVQPISAVEPEFSCEYAGDEGRGQIAAGERVCCAGN